MDEREREELGFLKLQRERDKVLNAKGVVGLAGAIWIRGYFDWREKKRRMAHFDGTVLR